MDQDPESQILPALFDNYEAVSCDNIECLHFLSLIFQRPHQSHCLPVRTIGATLAVAPSPAELALHTDTEIDCAHAELAGPPGTTATRRRSSNMEVNSYARVVLLVLVAAAIWSAEAQFDADGFLRPQNAARAQLRLAPLQWDARLASYAQGWAAQRRAYGDCRLQHSGGPYGENIFWGSGKAWQPEEAANAWVSERRWYRYSTNSCAYYNKCGHYTQVVWRGTTRVGCSRSVCRDGNVFMTCNYYPPGNWVGQRPY